MFKIYRLGVLACDGSACSRSIFNYQEAVREPYHGRIGGVYKHQSLSISVVKKWRRQCVNGRITLQGDPGREVLLAPIFVNLNGP
jgi:hypothetical protein